MRLQSTLKYICRVITLKNSKNMDTLDYFTRENIALVADITGTVCALGLLYILVKYSDKKNKETKIIQDVEYDYCHSHSSGSSDSSDSSVSSDDSNTDSDGDDDAHSLDNEEDF